MLFGVVLLNHVIYALDHAHLLVDDPLKLFNVLHLPALEDLTARSVPHHGHRVGAAVLLRTRVELLCASNRRRRLRRLKGNLAHRI